MIYSLPWFGLKLLELLKIQKVCFFQVKPRLIPVLSFDGDMTTWIFLAEFKSSNNGCSGSSACSDISLAVAHTFLTLAIHFLLGSHLSLRWTKLLCFATALFECHRCLIVLQLWPCQNWTAIPCKNVRPASLFHHWAATSCQKNKKKTVRHYLFMMKRLLLFSLSKIALSKLTYGTAITVANSLTCLCVMQL